MAIEALVVESQGKVNVKSETSHDSISVILKVIVQSRCQRVTTRLDQTVHLK